MQETGKVSSVSSEEGLATGAFPVDGIRGGAGSWKTLGNGTHPVGLGEGDELKIWLLSLYTLKLFTPARLNQLKAN